MKKKALLSMTLGLMIAATGVLATPAHGVFVANRLDEKALVLGEGPLDNVYKASNVQRVDGYSTQGTPIKVEVVDKGNHVVFHTPDNVGTTVTFFDYGHFTKDAAGKLHHDTFENVPNAVKSTHAIKYNVHIWNADVKPAAIPGVPIQIVPSVNPLTLHKGDTYEIQVLKDGKPMANAPLIVDVLNDLTNESKTDANGKATIPVTANGQNVVGVEIAYPTDTPGKQNKYFSSLSFIIYPE